MATKDYTLPDGFTVRLFDHGGIDVKNDAGNWVTVTSSPEGCAELARLATLASNAMTEDGPPEPS